MSLVASRCSPPALGSECLREHLQASTRRCIVGVASAPRLAPARCTQSHAAQFTSTESRVDRDPLLSPLDYSPFRDAVGGHCGAISAVMPGHSQNEWDPAAILLQKRIVFLGTQVDDFSADVVISQLLLLDAADPTKDITLLINSPGGSVTAGMGIYDAMKLCRADVSTLCFGLAASMGAFLLATGTKGKRYCMPNARVMIHQPLGGAQGSAIDVGLQVREMMYHKVKLNKVLSRATGQSEATIEEDTDRDNFMSAWEAVEYGLADGVMGADTPGLIAPIGEAKEPPKTKVWDLWTVKQGKERRRLPGEHNLVASSPQ